MMDVDNVRSHMDQVKSRLKKVEQEATVLTTLLRTYEGWLQLLQTDYAAAQARQETVEAQDEMVDISPISPRHPTASRRGMTLREAVQKVLRDADGEPLSARDIWLRVQAFGIGTNLKEPPAVLDYTSCTLRGVQKVGPRTWRWVGDEEEEEEEEERDGASEVC